ncbi:MAG: transcriptional regulator [Clostridia bacterium]|nr:transcriptional regulator [Clostridia bacterium]
MKNRIQELRKEKKITQEELAAQCRVTRQTIISLENGKYSPSIFLAHKIALVFGLTIEQVFLFEGEEQ